MPRPKGSSTPKKKPQTAANDNHPGADLALRPDYDETVWDHLAGAVSAPFPAGHHKEIAVKVIDDRGNELLVVKKLEERK
jgi:adenine-specific DNA-methyltransferase